MSGAIFQLETPINVIQAALAMSHSSPEALYPILRQVLDSSLRALDAMRRVLPKAEQERRFWSTSTRSSGSVGHFHRPAAVCRCRG
ncbi:MAG: hypothetical protein HZT40_09125 [Candidatus Thiothrix singaporensis]|uniref:Uncharacterized protein n=1 Tax=Candidatus Thiothrix singaporensis TaxID=2799669 RepID=A0A7L6ARK0_9GAMM|nr:MAG: hypothetical protein HZT40_09125 [Candidatus Thiothrix singaporensis]